ncbi:MAG: hypothetical protein ACRDRP_22155 [Pseudonocardiaceae bacterium]
MPPLSEPDAEQVADALDDLPMAVQQAAAFLAETGSTVETYLGLLASRAADVLAYGTHRVSLAASYQVAFDRLAIDEPAALDLLTLAAHLAPNRSLSPCSPPTPTRYPNHWPPQSSTR